MSVRCRLLEAIDHLDDCLDFPIERIAWVCGEVSGASLPEGPLFAALVELEAERDRVQRILNRLKAVVPESYSERTAPVGEIPL
jgi:hypothetical protein